MEGKSHLLYSFGYYALGVQSGLGSLKARITDAQARDFTQLPRHGRELFVLTRHSLHPHPARMRSQRNLRSTMLVVVRRVRALTRAFRRVSWLRRGVVVNLMTAMNV